MQYLAAGPARPVGGRGSDPPPARCAGRRHRRVERPPRDHRRAGRRRTARSSPPPGTTPKVVMDTAEACLAEGRLARRRDPAIGSGAIAEPIRLGQPHRRRHRHRRGPAEPRRRSAPPLRRRRRTRAGPAARRSVTRRCRDFSDALLRDRRRPRSDRRPRRACSSPRRRCSARWVGFCVIPDGENWRVAQYRGITAADLRNAGQHPDFRGFVASGNLRVEPPTHPVVANLVKGAETAVSVPLVAAGRRQGFLVLLLGEAPDQAGQALLIASPTRSR